MFAFLNIGAMDRMDGSSSSDVQVNLLLILDLERVGQL
jgi:hypothetical protein